MSTVGSIPAAAASRLAKLLWLAALASAGCTSVNSTQATFDGTRWRVTAVNQQPAEGDYIAFSAGRFQGTVGCNLIGGHYRVSGSWLLPAEMHATERGCVDPQVAELERQALAIMSHPMRLDWHSGQRLTLGNAAGAMTLERSGAD